MYILTGYRKNLEIYTLYFAKGEQFFMRMKRADKKSSYLKKNFFFHNPSPIITILLSPLFTFNQIYFSQK